MAKDKGAPVAEESAEGAEGAKKKGFPLWLIIVIAVQVVVIGGGIVVYTMLGKGGGSSTEEHELKEKAHGGGHGGGHGDGHGSYSGNTLIGPTYKLSTFIVNLLSDGQHTRYLKVDITFELEKGNVESELEERLPQIRDEIGTLLSSRRMSDVETPDGKRVLRDDIFTRINKLLTTGKIRRVYFTDLVIQ